MARLVAIILAFGVIFGAAASAETYGCKVVPNAFYQHVDARDWQWTALVPGGVLGTGFASTLAQGNQVCEHALSFWQEP